MKKFRSGFLSEILSLRTNIVEILLIAVFIALGINIIAGSLSQIFRLSPLNTFCLGIIICFIAICYFLIRVLGRRIHSRDYEAFFVYDCKKNKLISILRYNFASHLEDYLNAAFLENKALETIWNKEPLSDLYHPQKNNNHTHRRNRRDIRSMQLISEATEYYILSRLSTHLADYFNDVKFKKENLQEFCREDIPDVLLQNRFLELFSKSMDQRLPFVDVTFSEKTTREIVASYSQGAIYERFELILPKETSVHRLSTNRIEINTKRLVLTITVRFDGSNTVLPRGFEEHYLSIDPLGNIEEFKVDVSVKVSFKISTLLSGMGLEYYHWVDSFLDSLDKNISENYFFDSIGWKQAMTVIESLKTI